MATVAGSELTWCTSAEGWGPWSSTRAVDLTPCFEDGIFTNALHAAFLVAALGRWGWVLRQRHDAPLSSAQAWHYRIKQYLIGAAVLVSAAFVWYSGTHVGPLYTPIGTLSWLVQTLTLVGALALTRLEHRRNPIASAILCLFWLASILWNLIRLRTWWMLPGSAANHLVLGALIAYTTLAALALTAEVWPKPRWEYATLDAEPLSDSPEEQANVFSRLTFTWMSPLLKLGYQRVLTHDDLWDLPRSAQASVVARLFQSHWQRELVKSAPSLMRACLATFGGPFALAIVFKLGPDLLEFAQPQSLRRLLQFVQSYSTDTPQPEANGYFIALTMFATAMFQTVLDHQYSQLCAMTRLRVRAGLITAIYRKALRLSNTARQQFTVGEIVNHMSVDANRLANASMYVHNAWSGVLQICLCLYFLYDTLGWSAFAGVIIMIISMPVNGLIARQMRRLHEQQMTNKDQRIKLVDELLNGIKAIKLYAWESAFLDRIGHVRNDRELLTLKKNAKLSATQSCIDTIVPFMVSFATFGLYALADGKSRGPLNADLIFVSLSLLNLLQIPLRILPSVLTAIVEASVALSRIAKFLLSEELDSHAVDRVDYVQRLPNDVKTKDTASPPVMVDVCQGQFTWLDPQAPSTLSEVNITCRKGELVAVVGRVGSGKSSLISAILGDMTKQDGAVTIRGHVAYVAQQPWIMNATLRDNILFGHRYDPQFYQETIRACALQPDIDMLTDGDLTEIGEKGINLSGGQKARVSLARAVYARADVYLLDDPLSAVDAHVGKHLFDQVLGPHGLLRTKARILVTHAVTVLPKANTITFLQQGRVVEQGSFPELMALRGNLCRLAQESGLMSEISPTTSATATPRPSSRDSPILGACPPHSLYQDGTPVAVDSDIEEAHQSSALDPVGVPEEMAKLTKDTTSLRRASIVTLDGTRHKPAMASPQEGALMSVEESARGQVKVAVYAAYIRACSPWSIGLYLLAAVLLNLSDVAANLWLKHWSNVNALPNADPTSGVYYLGIYGGLGVLTALCAMAASVILWIFCAIRAARETHDTMLARVVRSPMSFFDTTPLGRIVNRFSKDQDTIDEGLPMLLSNYIDALFHLFTVMAVIITSTPLFLLFFVPLSGVYILVQRYYLSTSRELKRLDSTSRSFIYAHFQETLGGVTTIRAFQQTDRFIMENERRLEENLRAHYPSIFLNRWLGVRLESLGSCIILGASLLSVVTLIYFGGVDAGLVGLSMSYALYITHTLNWCIRLYCQIETDIVSMERIKEYSELPSEAPAVIPDHRPSAEWPVQGQVQFDHFAMRYRPGLDLVLRDVTFAALPGEKVGIVGRTGAGKSSLTLALFRIIEATGGHIRIDGVDIATMGLYDLRSRLTIIPQDPVLFTGCLRDNLDPYHKHSDEALWSVLTNAHLDEYVRGLPEKLDYTVHQGGENFSVGQRQLICLARALLRRTKVLILDEATASIDVETDRLIQETIRREFRDCTVLTIAHRINTVLDNDRILVMDQGVVVEYDRPSVLLANKQSVFYSLTNTTDQA